ncbi:MAG TPA: hypothetical protein PKD79_03575 [Candidatus Doudnabacteria bacterium]|nr:hypothetical protein [Candidatus Doudnabacteria bacterium]
MAILLLAELPTLAPLPTAKLRDEPTTVPAPNLSVPGPPVPGTLKVSPLVAGLIIVPPRVQYPIVPLVGAVVVREPLPPLV